MGGQAGWHQRHCEGRTERTPLGRPRLPLEVHRAEGCWGWACPEEEQRHLVSCLPTLVPCSGLFLLRASCNQPQGPGSEESFQKAAGAGSGASTPVASSLPCRRRAGSGLPPRTGLAVWLLEASPQPQRVPHPWWGSGLPAHLGGPARPSGSAVTKRRGRPVFRLGPDTEPTQPGPGLGASPSVCAVTPELLGAERLVHRGHFQGRKRLGDVAGRLHGLSA